MKDGVNNDNAEPSSKEGSTARFIAEVECACTDLTLFVNVKCRGAKAVVTPKQKYAKSIAIDLTIMCTPMMPFVFLLFPSLCAGVKNTEPN